MLQVYGIRTQYDISPDQPILGNNRSFNGPSDVGGSTMELLNNARFSNARHLKQLSRDRPQDAHGETPVLVLLEVIVEGQPETLEHQTAVPLMDQLSVHLHAKGR